jgi:hypothetical protein
MPKKFEAKVDLATNTVVITTFSRYAFLVDGELVKISLDKKEAMNLAADIAQAVKALRDPRWNQF